MTLMQLRHTDIRIQAERAWLDALLSFAPDAHGLIICAAPYIGHLRDSRLNYAGSILRKAHFATLVVSMMTSYEERRDPDVQYDISLLGNRLQALLTWIDQQPCLAGLPLGLLATGTVAGAAVRLLARDAGRISALVSSGGRIDLAGGEPLRRLRVPILLQIPGLAQDLIGPSAQAYAHLGGIKQWHEISNADALFIEPGTLEQSAAGAQGWFLKYLPPLAESPSPASDETTPTQS